MTGKMVDAWIVLAALALFLGYAIVGNGVASAVFLVAAGVWRLSWEFAYGEPGAKPTSTEPAFPWCDACRSYHHPDNPTCRKR